MHYVSIAHFLFEEVHFVLLPPKNVKKANIYSLIIYGLSYQNDKSVEEASTEGVNAMKSVCELGTEDIDDKLNRQK